MAKIRVKKWCNNPGVVGQKKGREYPTRMPGLRAYVPFSYYPAPRLVTKWFAGEGESEKLIRDVK